jgi:hypothetical protein
MIMQQSRRTTRGQDPAALREERRLHTLLRNLLTVRQLHTMQSACWVCQAKTCPLREEAMDEIVRAEMLTPSGEPTPSFRVYQKHFRTSLQNSMWASDTGLVSWLTIALWLVIATVSNNDNMRRELSFFFQKLSTNEKCNYPIVTWSADVL